MKKITIAIISLLAFVMASCNSKISPEIANAFKGEYWMETTSTTMNGDSIVDDIRTIWTPVTIYEERGSIYVQTEMLGAPDTISENPQEIQGTRERPDFIPRRIIANDTEETTSIENVVIVNYGIIYIVNGFICAINRGVKARTFPIKVKSGSKSVLNLESYKAVDVHLTDAAGNNIATIKSWYEYGPMVKAGEVIKWEVQYRDNFKHEPAYSTEWTHVIHKNVLYKK